MAIPQSHSRDDGVVGSFSASQCIEVPWLQAEAGASVLQADARAWHNQARAKAIEEAVDKGYGIALTVDYGQVDCVLVLHLLWTGQL
jgi:hypothetical protein